MGRTSLPGSAPDFGNKGNKGQGASDGIAGVPMSTRSAFSGRVIAGEDGEADPTMGLFALALVAGAPTVLASCCSPAKHALHTPVSIFVHSGQGISSKSFSIADSTAQFAHCLPCDTQSPQRRGFMAGCIADGIK